MYILDAVEIARRALGPQSAQTIAEAAERKRLQPPNVQDLAYEAARQARYDFSDHQV